MSTVGTMRPSTVIGRTAVETVESRPRPDNARHRTQTEEEDFSISLVRIARSALKHIFVEQHENREIDSEMKEMRVREWEFRFDFFPKINMQNAIYYMFECIE